MTRTFVLRDWNPEALAWASDPPEPFFGARYDEVAWRAPSWVLARDLAVRALGVLYIPNSAAWTEVDERDMPKNVKMIVDLGADGDLRACPT